MRNISLKEVLTAPRRIAPYISEEQVKLDLGKYAGLAREFGASDVKVIETKELVVDERVQMKCLVPVCHRYGDSGLCPPNIPNAEFWEKIIRKYRYAVLVKHDVFPKEEFVTPGKGETFIRNIGKHHGKLMEIVSKLEVAAFNDGYYLAMGFAGGSCRTVLCKGAPCTLLQREMCKFPVMARPSMEGVGIDVFNIASKVGWEIYPLGPKDIDPEEVPCALSVGLVLIY